MSFRKNHLMGAAILALLILSVPAMFLGMVMIMDITSRRPVVVTLEPQVCAQLPAGSYILMTDGCRIRADDFGKHGALVDIHIVEGTGLGLFEWKTITLPTSKVKAAVSEPRMSVPGWIIGVTIGSIAMMMASLLLWVRELKRDSHRRRAISGKR